MKKILMVMSVLTASGIVVAQTPEDALRYSWLQGSGTARSQGIANANGAIGGEISTIFSNPANIGFYKTSDFVVSGGVNLFNNKASYYGQTTTENKASGFLGTTGVVFGKPSYANRSLKSSAFAIAVNRTADFNNRVIYKTKASEGGSLVRTSMADYFIEDAVANGLNDYGNGLAMDAGWIEDDGTGSLSSPAVDLAIASGLEQQQEIYTNGGITEFAIAGAANINDKVYFGGSLGMPILRYGSKRMYTEQDPTNNDVNGFQTAWFDDDLITNGVGINLKAGVVFKTTENFRLGFGVHSPTFYSMSDSYIATAGTNLDDGANGDYSVTSDELIYEYVLQTPYKLMGSFSYFFGDVNNVESQKGFLSGDIEYVNYMASSFKNNSDDDTNNRSYFRGLNNAIDNAYKGALNARLGTELKFNTFMARFGGAYYGNPYKDLAGEEGRVIQASTGLGYRNKGFFIDLGYTHSFVNDVVFPYRLENNSARPAFIKGNNSKVLLTLGFKI